jgi:hypothetical protein
MRALLWLTSLAAGLTANATPKILGLTPATAHSCVAFRIQVPEGQALAGLRWHHNDSTLDFPRLLLLEAQAGIVPDLNRTGLILEDLSGEELGWGEVDLSTPVTSTTGEIYAVFVFPENVPLTGTGNGGGPGLGVEWNGSGPSFAVSPDGVEWIRYQPEYRLLVEPLLSGSAKMGAQSLAELAEHVHYAVPASTSAREGEAPAISRNLLHAAKPNPFNPRTKIRYDLRAPQSVQLRLYDVRGRLVRTLVAGPQPAGEHELIWEGVDDSGKSVASGVYFLRLQVGEERLEQRLTLVR